MMKVPEVIHRSLEEISPGDLVVDRAGNKLVIIRSESVQGDWLAFFNGKLKRISQHRVAKIKNGVNDNE